ncbi:MAG: PhzF family phenazine biosynthesis protein [Polyangiales bacterium]
MLASYAALRFRLVNVFARNVLEGNPLCVFEDARGLDDGVMQALALQMNLSETTFLFPAEAPHATAKVRILRRPSRCLSRGIRP